MKLVLIDSPGGRNVLKVHTSDCVAPIQILGKPILLLWHHDLGLLVIMPTCKVVLPLGETQKDMNVCSHEYYQCPS